MIEIYSAKTGIRHNRNSIENIPDHGSVSGVSLPRKFNIYRNDSTKFIAKFELGV